LGHNRLGRLPQTYNWQQVVGLLRAGADTSEITAAAATAAEATLRRVANDPTTVRAVWLLAQLPMAARYAYFEERLRGLGIAVGGPPDFGRLMSQLSQTLDTYRLASRSRSDIGEIARNAAVGALTAVLDRRIPKLLGAGPEDVRNALRQVDAPGGFSELTEEFAGRLTRQMLDYFLSRELSNHVGRDARFGNSADISEFNSRLDQHCREACRIVRAFGGEWHSKHKFQGEITPESARRFAHTIGHNICAELQRRRAAPHA
jgi:hypothetical protein